MKIRSIIVVLALFLTACGSAPFVSETEPIQNVPEVSIDGNVEVISRSKIGEFDEIVVACIEEHGFLLVSERNNSGFGLGTTRFPEMDLECAN